MPPRFQTVLFDLDGTLTDSAEGILNSIQHALGRIGRRIPKEETAFMIGPPLAEGFTKLLGDPELARRCVPLYREYFRDAGIFENKVYPGVPAMLESLRAAGIRTAVATSKPEEFARRIVDHFGLAPLLETVAGADMHGPVHAKRDVIRRCLGRMQVEDCTRALMVGDRNYDVAGAHEAGLKCAGVLYGYGSRAELAGADFLCGTPADVAEAAVRGAA